ncbi:MAG: amidohydrolase family protein, partial [Gemmatimonadales bacterium]
MRFGPLRTSLLAIFAAACGSPSAPIRPPVPISPDIAIVGARLWDGTGRAPVANTVTLIRGDRIVCAGSAGECLVPKNARVVDAQGQFLIPGLIDSHVHLLFIVNGSASPELGTDLRDLLAQGITTVRDMGTNPAELLPRVRAMPAAPRVYAMQLVAGPKFFFGGMNGFRAVRTAQGVQFHQPPAMTMQYMGWTPIMFNRDADPDSVVRVAQSVGAMGLKLYAELDSVSVRRLVSAAHRAGLTVWGHAWVQPASVREQATARQDGVVHAAGLAGELYTAEERDTLVNDGDLQVATALAATAESAHDPRVTAALDTMARLGTMFEPTLDATRRSVAAYDARSRRVQSMQEAYVRAAQKFGMEVTREALKRGVRISAGSDHVAYGPARDRATLFGELQLYVDSLHLTPAAALLAATRDAALAIGGVPGQRIGTIAPGNYADLVLLSKDPLQDIKNLDAVELVMRGGIIWRPGQLRAGIAMAGGR